MYPKDTTSVMLQCKLRKPNFTIEDWDIEDAEYRLCRSSELTEDIVLFIGIPHDEMLIKVVELYYAKEDMCPIVHIHIDEKVIICYYHIIGPSKEELEKEGIELREYRQERMRF